MSGEFSEHHETVRAPQADNDPAILDSGRAPETANAFEQYPEEGDDVGRMLEVARKAGHLGVASVIDDGWGVPVHADRSAVHGNDIQKGATLPTGDVADAAAAPRAEEADLRDVESRGRADGAADDGWGVELRPKHAMAPEGDSSEAEVHEALPLAADLIAERTTTNRIDLADNVRAIDLKQSYAGYLDVVMHGDETGTQAYIDGLSVDFTLSETAQMVESSPRWEHRPIRLLSCSTGRDSYAQELSDALEVPVYAPNGTLHVLPDGNTFIESPDCANAGAWRRFEPRQ